MSNENATNPTVNEDAFFSQLLQYKAQVADNAFINKVLNESQHLRRKRTLLLSIFGFIGLLLFFWLNPSLAFITGINFPRIEELKLQPIINAALIGILFISTWFIVEEV